MRMAKMFLRLLNSLGEVFGHPLKDFDDLLLFSLAFIEEGLVLALEGEALLVAVGVELEDLLEEALVGLGGGLFLAAEDALEIGEGDQVQEGLLAAVEVDAPPRLQRLQLLQRVLPALPDEAEELLPHVLQIFGVFQVLEDVLAVDGSKLLDEVLDGDGLMAAVALVLADAAKGGLVAALLVNAEAGEGLAGVAFETAVRVQLPSAHQSKSKLQTYLWDDRMGWQNQEQMITPPRGGWACWSGEPCRRGISRFSPAI